MGEKETKVKIRKCIVCGKEFNKYTRPWGPGPYGPKRSICSEECEEVLKKKRKGIQRIERERMKDQLKTWLIISLIAGVIGAIVGVVGGILGVLLGFVIGFFAPLLLAIICSIEC